MAKGWHLREALSLLVAGTAFETGLRYFPWPSQSPPLVIMHGEHVERAVYATYLIVRDGYYWMWFALPFFVCWMVTEKIEQWSDGKPTVEPAGKLPALLGAGKELSIVLGEIHHQYKLGASATPHFRVIPQKGVYIPMLVLGGVGAGKSTGFVIPIMDQMLRHAKRLGGLILDPNGDLQRHAM